MAHWAWQQWVVAGSCSTQIIVGTISRSARKGASDGVAWLLISGFTAYVLWSGGFWS